ncbi:MAG: hypothetical protein U0169_12935 [Polyangiaceae bacterium]
MRISGRFAGFAVFSAAVSLLSTVGCAVGSDGTGLFVEDEDGGDFDGGDAGRSPFETPVDAGGKKDGSSDGASTDGGSLDAGPGDAAKDASGDAKTDATPDSGATCRAANLCASAEAMGKVSGDLGNDTKSASGTGSKWFTIDVTEDSISLLDLSARIQLVAPSGSNYDLFVYAGRELDDGGGQECSVVSDQSTLPAGQSDVVNFAQPDTTGLFGFDNSRTLSIEVRHVSGPCDAASAPWQLTIDGHTQP